MLILMSLCFLMMFIYVNSLFYSMALLFVVIGLLYTLVSDLMLHSLTMLLLVIVYVGAMMILIGYICAICPNLILVPMHLNSIFYLLYLLFISVFVLGFTSFNNLGEFIPMTNYFYNSYGSITFFAIVFMLFITLLMVTSQYMTPKGPFRSVSI